MDEVGDYRNPFGIPNLWEQSELSIFKVNKSLLIDFPILPNSELKHPLPLLDDFSNNFASYLNGEETLESLADLDSIEKAPLEDLGSLSLGSASFSVIDDEDENSDDDALWQEAAQLRTGNEHNLQTWERFYHGERNEPSVEYVSESGAKVFDALIQTTEINAGKDTSIAMLPVPFLEALKRLLHARDSRIFAYDAHQQAFGVLIPKLRISGFTQECSQCLIDTFVEYAANAKKLRAMVHEIMNSRRSSTTLVSLASSALRIIWTIEYFYAGVLERQISLLQLQSLSERPSQIIVHLLQLLGSPLRLLSDVEILSTLWSSVLLLEDTHSWMHPVMFQLLKAVSSHWSLSVDRVLGLSRKDVSMQYLCYTSATALDTLPSWVEPANEKRMREIADCLELLKKQRPEHPLATARNTPEGISVHTHFGTDEIDRIQTKVANYEANMMAAITDFDSAIPSQFQPRTGASIAAIEPTYDIWQSSSKSVNDFNVRIDHGDSPFPRMHRALEDAIHTAIKGDGAQTSGGFTLPISLAPMLHYNAILTSQARLTNQACLRLIFMDHDLESHLSLQHRFFFLGDGVFASRLTHALFDSELPSTERKKGHQRLGTSGLRLGQRDAWPPASSELRLALSGILTECFESRTDMPDPNRHGELPGNLSFSVRPMSEEALKRCMDPNNIEALDFLTLQYQAPEPINAIITDTVLAKYDLVFKQLLRCQRMLHTVKQMCHPGGIRGKLISCQDVHARRFRIESHHFVVSICGYFHDRIGDESRSLWARLEETRRRVEAYSLHEGEGPQGLREFLETILDRILFALFLRKRQVQLLRLLEEIFSLILVFSKEVQSSLPASELVRELYQTLTKKFGAFVAACRGLSEKRDHAPTLSPSDGESMLGQLLLTLNMNEYYER